MPGRKKVKRRRNPNSLSEIKEKLRKYNQLCQEIGEHFTNNIKFLEIYYRYHNEPGRTSSSDYWISQVKKDKSQIIEGVGNQQNKLLIDLEHANRSLMILKNQIIKK